MYGIFPMYPLIPNLRKLSVWDEEPPTVYALLNSYVNYGKDVPVKIKDLAKAGRALFFDFEYPLTPLINKEDFECMILNHFLMRRIGYETFTSFNIAFNVKLNEIMPNYNKLFEALDGWELFDGESTTRDITRNSTGEETTENTAESTGTANGLSDRRHSDTPQNKLNQVQAGTYLSDYSYDTDINESHTDTTTNSTSNRSDNGSEHEEVHHTLANKFEVYQAFLKNRTNIYTMIFEDLEQLFYQLAD